MKYKLKKDVAYLIKGSTIEIDPLNGFYSPNGVVLQDISILVDHLFYNHFEEYFEKVVPPKPKTVWDLQPQDECYCIALGFVDKCTWLGTQQDGFYRDSWSVFLTESEAKSVLDGRIMKATAERIHSQK